MISHLLLYDPCYVTVTTSIKPVEITQLKCHKRLLKVRNLPQTSRIFTSLQLTTYAQLSTFVDTILTLSLITYQLGALSLNIPFIINHPFFFPYGYFTKIVYMSI